MAEIKLNLTDFIVLEQGNEYAILKRSSPVQPYVVAFCYDSESGSWASGNYFSDLKVAVDFFYKNDTSRENNRILSAQEFAAKVMKMGTEVEPNEYETANWHQIEPNGTVWTTYVHIDEDGEIVYSQSKAEWTLTADMKLTEEQSQALMTGELDDLERRVIIKKIYPQYVDIMENEL